MNPNIKSELEASNSNHFVFREFPVRDASSNNNNNNYNYLDIAFAIKSRSNIYFIAIEGKVTDRSVRSGQLKEYYKCINSCVTENINNKNIFIYLLSTIKENQELGIKSMAQAEVEDFKSDNPNVSSNCDLILWDMFKDILLRFEQQGKIRDEYFIYAYKDAFDQLDVNKRKDCEGYYIAKENTVLYKLGEYIGDIDYMKEFEEMFSQYISYTLGEKYQSLDINKLDDKERGQLIDWIIELFKRADNNENLRKYPKERYEIGVNLKNRYMYQSIRIQEKVEVLRECEEKISNYGIEEFPVNINEIIDSLDSGIKYLNKKQDGHINYSLAQEFIINLESDMLKEFYKELLLIKRELYANEYVKFRSNVGGTELNNLGIWVMPTKRIKKSEISLMYLNKGDGCIKITNGK